MWILSLGFVIVFVTVFFKIDSGCSWEFSLLLPAVVQPCLCFCSQASTVLRLIVLIVIVFRHSSSTTYHTFEVLDCEFLFACSLHFRVVAFVVRTCRSVLSCGQQDVSPMFWRRIWGFLLSSDFSDFTLSSCMFVVVCSLKGSILWIPLLGNVHFACLVRFWRTCWSLIGCWSGICATKIGEQGCLLCFLV